MPFAYGVEIIMFHKMFFLVCNLYKKAQINFSKHIGLKIIMFHNISVFLCKLKGLYFLWAEFLANHILFTHTAWSSTCMLAWSFGFYYI